MRLVTAMLAGLAACGRIGFDPTTAGGGGGGGGDGASGGTLAEADCTATLGTWGTSAVASGGCDWLLASPGTYTFVVPPGVTAISVVCVGGGGGAADYSGGGGGGLGWISDLAVSPGQPVAVVVGAGAPGNTIVDGGDSWVLSAATVLGGGGKANIMSGQTAGPTTGAGGTHVGDGGGDGGNGNADPGGGGAGGYSGPGGSSMGGAGSGGGGGGGLYTTAGGGMGGGGGGVGLLGEGASGGATTIAGNGGSGGSGGAAGMAASGSTGGVGGTYGGGAGGGGGPGGAGGSGACRILWPGDQRQFPSTATGPA